MFGSKKVIGLDIGTSITKIAELDVRGKEVTLNSFAMTATPMDSINNGEIINPGAISNLIIGLKSEIKTKRKAVCMGLWGNSVIVKKISIPKIDKKLLEAQLRFEAEQYIPFDINSIHLDYCVLPTSSSPETMDVILVAALTEIVNQYFTVITSTGLSLSVLDVSSFALANIFEVNYGKSPETIGVLNVGAGVTNLAILSSGDVIFARDFQVGGNNYTTEIQKELSITLQEAEVLKISASTKTNTPEQVATTLSHVNDIVAEEIRGGIDFFNSNNTGFPLSKLYVTGGSSRIPGLLDILKKKNELPIEVLNPFVKVKIGNKNLGHDYLNQINSFASIVMGLGIRQAGKK